MNKQYDNIAEGDHRRILVNMLEQDGELAVVKFIRQNMEKILEHYIGCTWGACYNSKFNDLIKPYLDDAKILDNVLRSGIIKERSNVVKGRTGAKIFDSLLFELRQCDSGEIREYLNGEFV